MKSIENIPDSEGKNTESEKQNLENTNSPKNILDLLDKARQGNTEHEDVYWHVFGREATSDVEYPSSWVNRSDLLEKFAVGKDGEPYQNTHEASHDLIEYLANEAEGEISKLTSTEAIKPTESEESSESDKSTESEEADKPEGAKEPTESDEGDKSAESEKPLEPEDIKTLSVDDLRDLYLKAKRLRGDVFRGKFGKLLKRKLNFRDKEMDFGGEKGALDLEKVRKEYQEKLSQYRLSELTNFGDKLKVQLEKGAIKEEHLNNQMGFKIINLLKEEQANIDAQAVEGIEKNIFEKMKTKWRQFGKTRLVAGALLGGAAIVTGGAGAVVGARAVMGGVGTYVGVEAGLERYSKLVGHKGLVAKINKDGNFITDDSLYSHIETFSEEDIAKEAARLRMLQVEKGVAIGNLGTDDNNRRIAEMIIKRDNELSAKKVMAETETENPELSFADRLSQRLSTEINIKNEAVESEVDRERIKKMLRKTTATLAGGTLGWLIGGKLFQSPDIEPLTSSSAPRPPILEDLVTEPTSSLSPEHIVTSGENTWEIIESNLDSRSMMSGLAEGPRTHMVDVLKDVFDNLPPEELRSLGFTSGDADLLYVGDTLNFSSVLDNPKTITEALLGAKNLSTPEITEIVKNNTKIAQWLTLHKEELTSVFDSSKVEQVLKGII